MNFTSYQARISVLILSIVFLGGKCFSQQTKTGYIQITCEPGIQIFLNGTFKGVSNSDQGGLILEDIPAGKHRLKVLQEGFNAQEETIKVESGKVFEYKVRPFIPKLKNMQQGASETKQVVRKVGSLKIQTLPIRCRMEITTLGVSCTKNQEEWMVGQIPIGTYKANFSALGKELSHSFQIKEDLETHLIVNILAGNVEDRSIMPLTFKEFRGKSITIPDLELELLPIPAGTFTMGSPYSEKDRESDEDQFEVTISKGFWMGKYVVTQAQYKAVMNDEPSSFNGDQRPVENVSWNDAIEFCNRVNMKESEAGRVPPGYTYTLPTEAEWEYSCRAGTVTRYAFGDSLSSKQANFNWNVNSTKDVGSYSLPNPWGFHDMHGNIWEWCYDQYGSYPSSSVSDHLGTSGSNRVLRGGCWLNVARYCRSANRNRSTAGNRNSLIGFRLCLCHVTR